ncbi:hypothetical protein IEQ34_013799 [Dendrobium chrysotoxum]|uniref:Uncharacterized protein n=1 Tax=Dendrobium chrysotoxum TaxID=161865 RepID=A0AAV7GS02_DENCH|nr:hypothetical protein IEQ34_013799 [Dendrobium chrysotoxum]
MKPLRLLSPALFSLSFARPRRIDALRDRSHAPRSSSSCSHTPDGTKPSTTGCRPTALDARSLPLDLFYAQKMPDNVLRSKLKEHMQYCMDHPGEISKLAKVQAQVSKVKGVMMENIEKRHCNDIIFLMIHIYPSIQLLKYLKPFLSYNFSSNSTASKSLASLNEAASLVYHNFCIYHITPLGHEVAIIFKYQQTVSKSHEAQVTRLDEKINELKAQMKEFEVDLTKAKMGEPLGKAADGKLKKNVVPELFRGVVLVSSRFWWVLLFPCAVGWFPLVVSSGPSYGWFSHAVFPGFFVALWVLAGWFSRGCLGEESLRASPLSSRLLTPSSLRKFHSTCILLLVPIDFMIYEEEILEDWKLQVMKPPRQLVVPAEKAQMRKQVVVRRLKSHAVLGVLPKTYGIGEEDEQTIYD